MTQTTIFFTKVRDPRTILLISTSEHIQLRMSTLLMRHLSSFIGQPPSADVPEKIRKWREEQISRLEKKDAQEVQTKELLRQHAEKELADWYKRHEDTITKTKSLNRWEITQDACLMFVRHHQIFTNFSIQSL